MITKKEVLVFSVSCIALIFFALSGEETTSMDTVVFNTKEDTFLANNMKYKSSNDSTKIQKSQVLKNRNALRAFKKKLRLNNLSQTIEKAKASVPVDTSSQTTSVPKADKKKKKVAKKKKDEKKKKVAKKKKSKLNPIKPLTPDAEKTVASKTPILESKDLSSTMVINNINSQPNKASAGKTANTEETLEESEAGASAQSVSGLTNNTAPNIRKSIFTTLLEDGRFEEFEQLLQSDLSEKKRIQAYTDSLNVLFASEDENANTYDLFIYNQFFNDKFAVIVSKSFNNPKLTTDQIRYSVAYLNQVVIEWKSESGPAIFKQIYQDNVSTILAKNEERKDFFSGLQSSIEAKSLLLSENAIEVSAN